MIDSPAICDNAFCSSVEFPIGMGSSFGVVVASKEVCSSLFGLPIGVW